MAIEIVQKITCDCCGKLIEIPNNAYPRLLYMYVRHGWTFYMDHWFCDECRPAAVSIDVIRHPHYSNYHDQWDNLPPEKCKSHFFTDEPYDHYADEIQHNLCRWCDYMNVGGEDDGSSWMMCCVENPDDHWGHNLYSGHFYGSAIRGRICPYFRSGDWEGRDPIEDKKNGTFHVPYNELYDGD